MGSQVLLALVLAPSGSSAAATGHALVSLAVALYLTLKAPRKWAAAGAGYIVGAEVLWRMTEAHVLWEYGKYASCLVLLVALWRLGTQARWRWLPFFYPLLLSPSVIILMANPVLSGDQVFEMVSFNLSGPLSLGVSAWFLSQLHLRQEDEARVLLAMLGPLLATGVVTLIRTMSTANLTFGQESNPLTSGGFGPNQVSAVLGLGALVAFLYALRVARRDARIALLTVTIFMAVQTVLTLSRGGFYGFALAATVTVLTLLRNSSMRRRIFGLAVPTLLLATAILLPRLDAFTDGALVARFEDPQTTGRTDIIREDLRIWSEHPLLGAGPGGARSLRRTESSMAHTEYSRVLAEHGAFGLAALGLLGLMSVGVLRRAARTSDAALNAGLLAWSLLSMSHAGMRFAAIGFIFGLSQARFASRRPAQGTSGGSGMQVDRSSATLDAHGTVLLRRGRSRVLGGSAI